MTRANQKLGKIPLEAWKPSTVRRYLDARESESRAFHEVRYMKRLFRWGVAFEHCRTNPCAEIRLKTKKKPSRMYISDSDYMAALNVAPATIALAAHFAYLTGRRPGDILKLTWAAVTDGGILVTEGKTGKQTLITWSDELRALVDTMKNDSIYLVSAKGNRPYTESGFQTAWQRVRRKLRKLGVEPFKFYDLRAKHATDFDEAGGDATRNLRHSSAAVTEKHYLRKPKKVVPLR